MTTRQMNGVADLAGTTMGTLRVGDIVSRNPLRWSATCERCGSHATYDHQRLIAGAAVCKFSGCGKRSHPVSSSNGSVMVIPRGVLSADSASAREYAREYVREDASEFADRVEQQRQAERRANTRPPTPEPEPISRIVMPPDTFNVRKSDTPAIRAALVSLRQLADSGNPATMPLLQSIREARQSVHERNLERIAAGETGKFIA
jgi:hypothetical protein